MEDKLTISQRSYWEKYQHSLSVSPLKTKAITAGTLNTLQELIALSVTGGLKRDSYLKPLKMGLYGTCIAGPLGHFLYGWLDRTFPSKDLKTVILKIITSNIVISPILNGCYLTALALSSGAQLSTTLKIVRTRLPKMLKTSWMIFPSVQAFAFKFIEPQLWLPFFNFVAFLFGTYMSIITKLSSKKVKGNSKSTD